CTTSRMLRLVKLLLVPVSRVDELMIAPRARVNGQEFEKVLHGFLVKNWRRPYESKTVLRE
ncbi:MAG: hypothetical protein WA641_13815, partial [Candidatus Acidiferrales bacterium]